MNYFVKIEEDHVCTLIESPLSKMAGYDKCTKEEYEIYSKRMQTQIEAIEANVEKPETLDDYLLDIDYRLSLLKLGGVE